ncbi:uncharacterized protein LOC129698331 [Leucoraja erinacea]|uniref:uncharacterized protein LOC129698331 n=1 Tax=Leucoraja erinaceus TaxID=7782 RepID=UPI00245696BF|nr:uncharacterized protein LOC129698331 [Leucoraja erinacea]
MPIFDHLVCECCEQTFSALTSVKPISRCISCSTSQCALKGGGKNCPTSSDSRQTFLRQNLLRRHASVGTNTSDQFSSEEIWRMTPSISWTNTEDQCIVTNNYLDKNHSDSSRSSTTWKENSELFLSNSVQTAKPYSNASSVKKLSCVNAKRLASHSALQTPVCSSFTPVSTPVGFEIISLCSSDGSTAMKQMESLAFSNDVHHLEEKYAEMKNTDSHTCPLAQEFALLTQENIEKFELLQLRKDFQENQEITDKDWQMENEVYQTMPSEQNVAQMALESPWELPCINRKSLSVMVPPISPLPKIATDPTIKEIKMPNLTENEFNLQQRIGMQQWGPASIKKVNSADWINANIIKSEVPTINKMQATSLKLHLGKNVTCKLNGFVQHSAETHKPPEVRLEDDYVELVEMKAQGVEKSPLYHNQMTHFEVKPSKDEVNSFEAMKKIGTARFSKHNDYQESHLGKQILQKGSKFLGIKQRFEELLGYHSSQTFNKPDVFQQHQYSAHQPSKTESELMNESVLQEIGIANENIEFIQLTKTENMPQLNCGVLETTMNASTKLNCISETMEPKVGLTAQTDVLSKTNEKEKIYQAIARHESMTPNVIDMHTDTIQYIMNESEMFIAEKQVKIPARVQGSINRVDKQYKMSSVRFSSSDMNQRQRPGSLPFIKKDAIKYLEMDFKNRLTANFWENPNNIEKSTRPITSEGASLTMGRDVQIAPIVVESAFIDEKMRNCFEWYVTQRKHQNRWGLSSSFERPTDILISPFLKCISSQLIDSVVITNKLPFITEEHKNMIERNVKEKIASNNLQLQQSLDYIVDAPLQSESLERNDSLLKNTDTPYLFKTIPHQEDDIKGLEKFFPTHDGGMRNEEINKLKELCVVTTLKLKVKRQLHFCLTKQHVEIISDCLPNVVMESYEQYYHPVAKKCLPKLINVGKGYKKPRPLYIPFMKRDVIDRLEISLRQKLILSLWGSPNSFEKSLETTIPKAPPVPSPCKVRAAKIDPIGIKIDFIEKQTINHLERHIAQTKSEFNCVIPTEIQRSRDIIMPPAPVLMDSKLKLQSYVHSVMNDSSVRIINDEHKKALEANLKKKIINHKRGLLPNFVQKSLINVMDSHSLKGPIASSDIIKERKILAGNLESYKRILREDNRKSSASTKVFKDKLEMCSRKQCLEINMDSLPEIVKEAYKVAYCLESKYTLPKLISIGRGYTKSRPKFLLFIERDLIDCLELNLKHKQISHLWKVETLHERSLGMIFKEQSILPSNMIIVKEVVPVALKTYFISNHTRSLLEWHITQKKLQHIWSVPLHIQRSQQAFSPPAPKLIASQLKPQPDFDVNIILIEHSFFCAESKKRLELNVLKRIINNHWGLPKFVHLSLESFIPHAPSVRPQLVEENKSLVNGNFKTVCLSSKILRPKDGKITTPQCEQTIKFVKAIKKRILPIFDHDKSEHKDKLDMCLFKQRLELKLNHLPSIVQELYENTYPSEPKQSLSKLLTLSESLKKTRPEYIPFFERDAIEHLEMNLKNKHISHLWGFHSLHEKSMEFMIPKAPPVLPAIKANRAQMEAVPMEAGFIGRDIRDKLEWHIIQKKLQHNWGLPFYYQNSVEALIPAAPKVLSSQLNLQFDFIILNAPCELSFVDIKIIKKLELNIRKKIINQRWGLPTLIQSSLEVFIAPAPQMNIIKPSEPVTNKKLKANNIEIKEPCKNENPQKTLVQLKRNKFISASYERTRRNSKTTRAEGMFVFAQLKQEDKHKLDICLTKQCLEIHMNSIPEIVMKFYKITYLPISKKSLPHHIVSRSDFKKPRSVYISFIEQDLIDQLELNLKHKQINHLWRLATLYIESLEMLIPSGPPVPPSIKASGAQIEPVGREIIFSTEVRKDLHLHVIRKKLQHNEGLPLHIQKSENIFIPSAPKLMLSKLNRQPYFDIIFIPSELTFLNEEHKRILEFNVKKRIVNQKWGLPKVILSSLCNFMARAPSMKDVILQDKIIKNKNNVGSTLIKKKSSRMFHHNRFPQYIQEKYLLHQNIRGSNNKTSKNIEVFLGLKPEHKDQLDVCIAKQSLEVKMYYSPKLVKVFYKNTYAPPSKKRLPRLIACNEGFKKPRLMYTTFVELDAVDRLELNLKHKQINHLWGFDTAYEMSVKMIIPKGPNAYPMIRSKGHRIQPVGVETAFIEVETRNVMEWHIRQRKLENTLDLPLHILKSIDMWIPTAPKLISGQSNQHYFNTVAIIAGEPDFISSEHRKRLELNTKKKIINQKWGLPNLIQLSLKTFMAPPLPLEDCALKSKIMKEVKTFPDVDVEFNSKMMNRDEKGKLASLTYEKVSKNTTIRKISAFPDFVKFEKEYKYKVNSCLLMQIINTKLHWLPDIAQEFYKNYYPAVLKKTLPKPFVVNEGFKKQRPRCLPFVEQNAIYQLELNLKHKQIIHLWKLETLYDKSIKMMILKGPPLAPAIKANETKIESEGSERSSIAYNIRDGLEWHITQKKLQQNWGLPLHIEMSLQCFIPLAPKLIPSQLNLKPSFRIMVALNELPFLIKEHKKLLELNIRKKIINHKWGLPTLIQSSLKNFMGLNGLRNDRVLQSEITIFRNVGLSKIKIPSQITKTRTLLLQHKKDSQNAKPCKIKLADIFDSLKQESINKLDVCLRKLHLEIQLHCLPEIVKQLYKENYPSISNTLLEKMIVPSEERKKPRSLYIVFIEQDAVDRLEMNLKHQLIFSLWGLATPYEKSIDIMIAKGPPVPPAVKSQRANIVPMGMETLFIAERVRENLERQVIREKLQKTWDLPLYVQRSEEAYIPIAPKLVLSELKPQPTFSVIIVSNELAFLHDHQKKLLEMNTRKKIINCKFGLPTLIQSSLNMFTAVSSDLCSLTNMDNNESKTILQHSSPTIKCGKLSTTKDKICDRSEKSKKIDNDLLCTRLKPERKNILLETCVLKSCLEIKIGYIPEMVSKSYENTCSAQSNKPLPKLIALGRGFKKTRPYYLPFIEQDVADHLELNLRHKQISHLWKISNLYDKSKERMISEGPPVPPAFKGNEALIYPEHLEIGFIDDEVKDNLEWHITQKKLQHHFGLPLLAKISQGAFIPSAPKLIPSQLKPQLGFTLVFASPELSFLSSEQRKCLELITRKRIINYKWGLPKAIQSSLNSFMASFSLQSEMMERNEELFCISHTKNKKVDIAMNRFLQPKNAELSSNQNQKCSGILKPNSMREGCFSAKLDPEYKDRLELCLIKQCLDIKNGHLSTAVYKMYETAFCPISKKPFPKPIAPGKGFKKLRSLYIPFIEQDAVDCLELNLRHKHLTHLCGITTLFKESVALLVPKGPPTPPAIKASGAQIEHVGMETTFIDSEITESLEWHIVRRKLQHIWDSPLHIQISQERFMPAAPKLIASQLKPQISFAFILVPAELIFLTDGHRKVLELNMKKRIVNRKWNLPKSVQSSVSHFIPDAPQMKDFVPQPQNQPTPIIMMSPPVSRVLCMKNERLLSSKLQKNKNVQENHKVPFDNFKAECEDVVNLCLVKQSLEIKMDHLPDLVKDSYSAFYAQASEKTLTKSILPGQRLKKQRSSYMPFTVQAMIDCLELNLKHKQIIHQWGFQSLHEESLEMMNPKGPPLPPIIKARGGQIEHVGMKIIFIESKTRERLEWQIKQKTLQYIWGLPIHIQSSLEMFIPVAPKLILSQLTAKPDFAVVVVSSEAAFLSDEYKQILDRNIKKRIINRKWGLPKVISASLFQFMATPIGKGFILPSKDISESNITYSNNLDKSYEIFSQGTNLRLKGGTLLPQYENAEMTLHKVEEIITNLHLMPECKHNLNMNLTKQCLESKINCIPKLVKDLYKITYSLMSKKQLPKIIVPGRGLNKTRSAYIPFVEQYAVDRIDMNLKHRQLLYLWGLQTISEKSMEMMISKAPPLPPLINTGRVGINHFWIGTCSFSDEVTKFLDWHILRKKMQHMWASSSQFQKSAEAFIPLAPNLTLTHLNPQPNLKIKIATVELSFVNNEHKKVLEMYTKKKIINHRWGLPKVIESSLNEFMAPPPLIKDTATLFQIKEKCRTRFRSKGLSKNHKMISAKCTSHLSKGEKSTLDSQCLKENVRMKSSEISVIDELLPENRNKLNMCLMNQNVSNKLDCVPELVTELYQQTYHFVLMKPLAKLTTAGKGFKRARLSHILFAEQDIINSLEMNLKLKKLNNLWGSATTFDMSIERMIPEAPPLFPAIKAIGANIEHVGIELTFQSAETIDMLEWHIKTKKCQHNLGIPLHIQRSIDTFILPPPKLVLSQCTQYSNFDIALFVNDLIFINEEHKEALETNINNQVINHSQGIPNIIQASLNSFITPAPTIIKDIQLLSTEERSAIELEQYELSKINIIEFADHNLMTSTSCRDVDECSNVDCIEESFACPKLESNDKQAVPLTKQPSQMKSLDKRIRATSSKHFLNLNDLYTRFKKQNLKNKCYDHHLEIDYSIASSSYTPTTMKTVESVTGTPDMKLSDLACNPVTIGGLSVGPTVIGENLASSPSTMQEDLSNYQKQNKEPVLLTPPGPNADCEEMLLKNAMNIEHDESLSKRLTEEANIHVQQDDEHGIVKLTPGFVNDQNEKENMQVNLSGMICSQPPPVALCKSLPKRTSIAPQIPDDGNYLSVSDEELHNAFYESLNKSYHTSKIPVVKKKCRKTYQNRFSNQSQPEKTLVKPKTTFSRQICQKPRTFKHKEEGMNSELGSGSILFVEPNEELQDTNMNTCDSDTDQKETSLTQESSQNYKDHKQSSQSSKLQSPGCQHVLPIEDPPFAVKEDFEVYYQCEGPLLTRDVH